MASKDKEMPLPKITVDDLFSTQEERDKTDKVKNISIDKLVDFPKHPFKVKEDENLLRMVDSIKEVGVLNPIIVREKEDGNYELIAGHRRKLASLLANKEKIPAIIKKLTDDEATILMVDSNIQREELLPSEKGFAYKMKLEALKHQGKRNDLTSSQVATKLSANIVGKEVGESKDNIYRYIRLTELIPELLNMVDDKKIAFNPAVEISYLTENEQKILLDCIECNDATPSHAQTIKLKKLSQEGSLDEDKIDDIMSEEKANQKEKVRIDKEKLSRVLPKNITQNQVEDFVIRCVEDYCKRQKQRSLEER